MRAERLEAQGIRTAGQLYSGLASSGLRVDIATQLYSHEKAHADADEERRGEFGFIISSGWVIAYYLIQGERTPDQLMKIAAAPGFSNMSSKDWQVYNEAWKVYLRQLAEEKHKHFKQREINDYRGLRKLLIEILAEKLDKESEEGEFPTLEELLGYEFNELIHKYGRVIYIAYREAISVIQNMQYRYG